MKKLLFSVLLSAVMCLTAPALKAEAAQTGSGSFKLKVEEPVIQATYGEVTAMPATEYNADKVTVVSDAYTIGDETHLLLELDDIFGEKRPNMVVYDEDGNSVYGSSSTTYGNEITMRFSVDAFTGSKTYTFIFYYYDYATDDYEKLAVKKATVTAKDWVGSISVSKESIYAMEHALYCNMYLPATIDTNAVEFWVYDGDKVVGYIQPNGEWQDTSYIYMASLVPKTENTFWMTLNDSAAKSNYGEIYFARKVEADKSYAIKAIAGNKTYDLGSVYVDGSSYVSSAYSDEFATSKPVVRINAYGYKLSDLLIQIKDPETKAVLATSEGGTCYYISPTVANFVLQSSKSSAELDDCDIVVSYQGKELYSNTYYDSVSLVTAYYNHADKVVVVKTTGLPDGTILKAEINDTYTAEGTVTGNSAILQFKKDGAVCELPVGDHDVDFTYTYKKNDYEYERTSYIYVEVMGSTVSGNYEYSANYIDDRYFESGKESPFVITITPNNLEAESGAFVAKLMANGEQVGSDIALEATTEKYDGVDTFILKGNIPATVAGNYSLYLYRGDTYESSYSLYMLDADKVYARTYNVSYDDGKAGIELYMPQSFDGYDKTKFVAKVTDIMGNDIGVKATSVSVSSSYYVTYRFDNVPEDVASVKVTFTYEGKPVYDIDMIASSKVLAPIVPARYDEDYDVSSSSMYNDQDYFLRTAFWPSADSVVYVMESGTLDVLKTWKISKDGTYLTKEMLEGLSYNDAKVRYDLYFAAEDGSGYDYWTHVYFGYKEQTVVVENGIGIDAGGAYVLYQNGQIATGYNGMYYYEDWEEWMLIKNGKVDTSYTGFTLYNDVWWYIANGFVDFNYVGVAELNGNLWYVKNGTIDFSMNGLGYSNDDWYYIVQGRVDTSYSGTAYINDAWWYVVNGKVDFSYTGLTFVNEKWWYVNAGRIDFNYCGPCQFNGATWFIMNGEIDYVSDGLVCTGLDWYLVKDGQVRTDFTGLAFINDAWWYVVSGKIDFAYCGLMFFNNEWWYVQGGKIDFTYNNVYYFNDTWYYIETGKVNFGYNGLAYTQFNDKWWYVINGMISFDYTGAAYAQEKYWYVERGEIDFSRVGKVTIDGVEWNVSLGEILGM